MSAKTKTYKSRDEIPDKYKWNVSLIFKNDKEWENTLKNVNKKIPLLEKYKSKLGESSEELFEFINLMHEVEQIIEKLYVYAHLKKDEDTRAQQYQEFYEKSHNLYTKFSEATSFFTPEIMAIPKGKINSFINEDVRLNPFKHFFEDLLRQKKHVLSTEQEKLLAMAGEALSVPGKVFSMLDNADMKYGKIKDENGKEIELTKGLYGKYQQHPDRRLRNDSYKTLYQSYIAQRNTLATNYYGLINVHIFNSRSRKYDSTLNKALDANNIPPFVYKKLIEATNDNLKPMYEYVTTRKKILNLEEIHDYDLLAPLAPQTHKEYNYEEALELVLTSLQPLGDEYITTLRKGIDKGWIDVYENPGKRSGAYSSGAYLTQPYVLLNFSGTLNDIFTIAHELGHSMHSHYTRKNNPYVYGDYSIFLAEIASTLNEGLLTHYLINNASSKEEKISLLNEQLDKFARTFYRQVIFAEFEWETHKMVEKGEPLTADKLDSIFGDLYKKYHGKDFEMVRETTAMWSRVPHFYYNYYVFQYATGIAASTAILADIINEGSTAVNRYLEFLKAGSRDYPLNILKKAGVDMTQPEPVLKSARLMETLLKELQELTS